MAWILLVTVQFVQVNQRKRDRECQHPQHPQNETLARHGGLPAESDGTAEARGHVQHVELERAVRSVPQVAAPVQDPINARLIDHAPRVPERLTIQYDRLGSAQCASGRGPELGRVDVAGNKPTRGGANGDASGY